MPEIDHSWIFKLLRFFTRSEVKTPLAFLFRVVLYLVASLLVVLYAPIGDQLKLTIVELVFGTLVGLSLLVLIFAWWRPKHLVYGETGHRAEHKLEFGTETHSYTREESELLTNSSDPKQPLIERD